MGITLGLTLGRVLQEGLSFWGRNASKGSEVNSIWKAGVWAEREPRSLGLHAEDSQSQLCSREQQLLTSR